jgi:hypothetical protein
MIINNKFHRIRLNINIALLFLLLFFVSISYADCISAKKKCENECNSAASFFNFEKGKYESVAGTDFAENCVSACSRGYRYCNTEDNLDESCYQFKRKCSNDCPTSIFSYRSSVYRLLTDAQSICEDACRSGYRRCN